jgi:hypothetical protein
MFQFSKIVIIMQYLKRYNILKLVYIIKPSLYLNIENEKN